jgi:hypothetical protein
MEILSGVVGIVILALLFKPFFETKDRFIECVKYWFTPDVISIFKGNWGDDRDAELKLVIWLALGIGGGLITYYGLKSIFA